VTRPLRICVIASARFPVAEPFMGGLEAHTHALSAALIARGHEVSVFAAPGSDPHLGVHELPLARFTASRAARSDVGSSPDEWMAEHHAYLDLMMGLADGRHGHFDVVHNNSLHHLPVALSGLIAPPVVTTLHTPPVAWLESAARLSPDSCTFVAVSRSIATSWAHVADAHVVHNGIDTEAWTPGPGGGPAVWTGRLVPEKAPHEAIDAVRAAGMRLLLAGPVHDPAYFAAEVEPRLGPDAEYVGHLDARSLAALVGQASVAVVTPRWPEPFGLVAAEALSCGTPVAAYDVGALGEVVTPATGRLVGLGDTAALGRAMREATRLDRSAARHHAVASFGLDQMVSAYEDLYEEVAA
jgi:glycosyltransferase involved in cell wall biosynthesis